MKKIIFFFVLATLGVAITATAQRIVHQSQSGMPDYIQRIITDCSSMTRVGELPNGDVIFFVSGLPTRNKARVHSNDGNRKPYYQGGEVLLIRSHRFDQWAILQFNPSLDYIIYRASINSNWEIEVDFAKNIDFIKATFNLKEDRFIYRSQADEDKLDPKTIITFD